MFGPEKIKQKVKTEVELLLSDGVTLKGYLFISPQDRLLETLNDARAFLPIEGYDGGITAINKTSINRIKLMDQKITFGEVIPLHIGQ